MTEKYFKRTGGIDFEKVNLEVDHDGSVPHFGIDEGLLLDLQQNLRGLAPRMESIIPLVHPDSQLRMFLAPP